MKTNLKGITSD
jgi:hypothetical protein